MPYNKKMANKGRGLEETIKKANRVYRKDKIALIQKVNVNWIVKRKNGKIIGAHPGEKSTLDFAGTIKGGLAISFDAKETKDPDGLPLSNIAEHQIEYMKEAAEYGEFTFVICYSIYHRKRYFISNMTVCHHWNKWKENQGKKGYNKIPFENMIQIKEKYHINLDYLQHITDTSIYEPVRKG